MTLSRIQSSRKKRCQRKRHQWRFVLQGMLRVAWIACGALATHQLLQFGGYSIIVSLSGALMGQPIRGHLFLVNNNTAQVEVGEVVSCRVRDRNIQMVRRVMHNHQNAVTGQQEFLTKSDDNRVDDRGLYPPGQLWLERHGLLGKVIGTLPTVGWLVIYLNDYPLIGMALMGAAGQLIARQSRPLLGRTNPSFASSLMLYILVFAKIIPGSYS